MADIMVLSRLIPGERGIKMEKSDILELAEKIRMAAEWSPEDLAALCSAAGMAAEWEAADGDTFEAIAFAAAEKLGVEIV